MIQQFIELGQGYGDIFELCELMKTNEGRIHHAFIFISNKDDKSYASLAVAFKPVGESKFMPIYVCREGIPYDSNKRSKRLEIFEEAVSQMGRQANRLEVKHSSIFSEANLFYQYLIGILRLNHYIPPMH
ncbi:methylthioribose kinase [Solibacillus sp. CAU 1738]|uniref:DUF7147 family protein n=1 Tax=Solibacillus sp. CAU 1738 TaxID=3140363 RepID=UPI00326080A8